MVCLDIPRVGADALLDNRAFKDLVGVQTTLECFISGNVAAILADDLQRPLVFSLCELVM